MHKPKQKGKRGYMFKPGDYVIYGTNGLCQIKEVTTLSFSEDERLYYCLTPVDDEGSQLFVPVGQNKVVMRKPVSIEEIDEIMNSIPELDEIRSTSDRAREEKYKEVMKKDDCREWMRLLKTMYVRKKTRSAEGRKMTAMDERYTKAAKQSLFSELSFVLQKDKTDIENYITEKFESIC